MMVTSAKKHGMMKDGKTEEQQRNGIRTYGVEGGSSRLPRESQLLLWILTSLIAEPTQDIAKYCRQVA